jgi:hypothetical protein
MLPNFKVLLVKSFLSRIVKDPNVASNVVGTVLVLVLGANLDFSKIFAGDPTEIGKAVGIACGGVLSYYVGKGKPEAKPAS